MKTGKSQFRLADICGIAQHADKLSHMTVMTDESDPFRKAVTRIQKNF
jgi:hypothetical protein